MWTRIQGIVLGITDKDIGAVLEEESQRKICYWPNYLHLVLKQPKKFNSRLQKLVLLDDMEIIQTLSQAEFELIGILTMKTFPNYGKP